MTVAVPNTLSRTLLSLALASCFGGFGADTQAAPTAPTVAAGQASFAQNGKTLLITNSPGTVINWQGFSIAQDETTRFIQQSATSAVLNRVTGSTSSSILGQLQSNGQVFLINPNGIVVGPTGRIDTAGFVASSLELKDGDFIARRFKFEGSDKAGKVINQGEITTPAGGKIWLIAPSVGNSGMITTPEGQIILAAGKKVTIADSRYPSVFVEVQAPDGEAVNLGQVIAKSGEIGMFGRSVKNAGTLNANAAVIENGKVVFKRKDLPAQLAPTQIAGGVTIEASENLTLAAGSQISADGPQAGEIRLTAGGELAMKLDSSISANGVQGGNISAQGSTLLSEALVEARGSDGPGGRILLLGQKVALLNRSRTDASGDLGGGVVLVGGDYQGKNPDVMNATATHIAEGAEISADAIRAGDGGKLIVWANDATRYHGTISARGGSAGGDGGFVEVSGKNYLDFNGAVDTLAPLGATGTLLLDPTNLTIVAGSSSVNVTGATPFEPASATGSSLGWTNINTALASSAVDIKTTTGFDAGEAGNITIAGAGTLSNGNTLSIIAGGNIVQNALATVTRTAAGAGLNLTASSGSVSLAAAVTTAGGEVNINSASVSSVVAGSINTTGAANGKGGNVLINTTGVINLTGAITTTGGTAGASQQGRDAGTVTLSGVGVTTGTITANGSAATTALSSQAGGSGGAVQVISTNGVSVGAISASGGAATTTIGAGGNAGSIEIANSGAGTISTVALTAQTGLATGAGGAVGNISVAKPAAIHVQNTFVGGTVSVGAVSTSGAAKGNGGNVVLSSAGGLTTSTITTSGGAAVGTMAGLNAGTVTLSGVSVTTGGAITASGSNGIGADAAGGNAGAVQISSTSGAVTTTAGTITATGGNAVAGNGAGGDAANVTLQSTGGGSVTTGALVMRGGSSFGTGVNTTARTLTVSGGNVNVGAITASGQNSGVGGIVDMDATGTLTASTISTAGGTALSGTSGRAAGAINMDAASTMTVGAITATGSYGLGANQAGGNGAAVSLVSSGGNVTVTSVTTSGGNAVAGVANGGAAGAITLDAGGTTPSITLAGNLSAVGGNQFGGGTSGAGANIRLKDATLLNAAAVTLDARGGNAGVGTGGDIQFDGAVDSTGGVRALLVNTNGSTILNGAIGATAALLSLTTDAGGTTQIGGGAVNTSGAAGQSYGDALSLTMATTLSATGGTTAFTSTVAAGANDLIIAATEINFSGNVTGTAALTLKPSGTLTSMSIASGVDTGGAVLDLTTADLALVQSGFSSVTYGRNDSAAGTTVTVNSTQLRSATSILTGDGTISGAGNVTGDVAGRALTVSTGSAGIINLSGTLGTAGTRLGAVSASAGGAATLGAINANGTVLARAGGNLTLNGVIATTDTSTTAIVASAGANFANSAGASALSTGAGGRWLVYTSNPATATFGSLASGNLALWNKTYAGNAPAGITQTGNRYLFNQAPNLTVTSTSAVKTYGDDLTGTLPAQRTITGANASTYGGAVVADSSVAIGSLLGGAPAVTSAGAASTASVAGSAYAVSVANGTLTSLTGYGLNFVSTGTISVNPAPLTITANSITKTYGGNDPVLTFVSAGLKNGESQALVFTGAQTRVAGESVTGGPYAISQGTLAANANYNLTSYTGNNLSITTAPLSVRADDKLRLVGTPNPPFTATFSGFVLAETPASLGGTLQYTNLATLESPSGLYAITPFGLTSSNYSITHVPGVLALPSPNTVNSPLAASLYAFAFSTLNPNAIAVGGTGSIMLASDAEQFLNTLPPTAAGSNDGLEPAAVGDTGTDGFQPVRLAPTKRQSKNSDCFNSQPLARLACK